MQNENYNMNKERYFTNHCFSNNNKGLTQTQMSVSWKLNTSLVSSPAEPSKPACT